MTGIVDILFCEIGCFMLTRQSIVKAGLDDGMEFREGTVIRDEVTESGDSFREMFAENGRLDLIR